MRKLIASTFVSLDGILQTPGGLEGEAASLIERRARRPDAVARIIATIPGALPRDVSSATHHPSVRPIAQRIHLHSHRRIVDRVVLQARPETSARRSAFFLS